MRLRRCLKNLMSSETNMVKGTDRIVKSLPLAQPADL